MQLSAGKRRYVLFILTLVYMFNFLDRRLMSILLPAIREEFSASDSVLGLLAGTVFAVFYVTVGIPVARLADRFNRRNLLAAALALWSGMTMLCGAAGNVIQLALARVGVGVGEAGGSPPSHSIIADLYAPSERGFAMGIYTLGISAGIMLAYLGGGWLVASFGWREAFFYVGAPGVLLALVVWKTVPEPLRGSAEQRTDDGQVPGVADVVGFLLARRSFVHMAVAAGITSFVGYSVGIWMPSFMERSYDMPIETVGLWLGLIAGVAGGSGYLLGGYIGDRLSRKRSQHGLRFLAIAIASCAVLYLVVFLGGSPVWSLSAYILPACLATMYLPQVLAQTQSLVLLRMRALASAVMLFIINVIGLAVGPPLVGFVSEQLVAVVGENESLRYSLLFFCVTLLPWAGLHFWLASRTIDEDLLRTGRA